MRPLYLRIYSILITILCGVTPQISHAISVNKSINSVSHQLLEAKVTTYQLAAYRDDGIQKVVIDAGHGGHDPGCMGKHSVEKDIALSIALKVGKDITKNAPHIEVIYTRKTDVFIPLHKRIDIANKAHADIFVSIHCNYVHNPKVCGTETFVMGLHRAEENLKVAKRENKSVLLEEDYEANYEGYDPNSPVGHILLSMFQNVYLDQSIALAAHFERHIKHKKQRKSRGVKQAGFVVLRKATMPSILVEAGFLSNRKEEKYLLSKNGQNEIATTLRKSIVTFFDSYPTPTPKKSSVIEPKYTIQVGVFSSDQHELIQSISSVGNVNIRPVGNVYRYTVGTYALRKEAEKDLSAIHDIGLKDAFIKGL